MIGSTRGMDPAESVARAATIAPPVPILYHCAGSRGLRALWALEELSIDYELRLLPFPPRIRDKSYFDINPIGTVPALVCGDVVMTESSAIVHYLIARYGPSSLLVEPHEADFAAFLDYLHHADATLTFPLTIFMRFNMFEKARELEAAGTAYIDFFRGRLAKLSKHLERRDHICCGRFTGADIAIGYALLLCRVIGFGDLLPPVLQGYLDRLTARPAYARARARETEAGAKPFEPFVTK